MLTNEEICELEEQRFASRDEAELHANDLANDDLDGDVVQVGDLWAVVVVRE